MLMRDQDGRERLRIGADGLQALEGFLAGKAGVDQQTRPLSGNQGAVAGTRRRKNRDFEDGKSPKPLEPETGERCKGEVMLREAI
jgi:hypothetical protein